ncbi:MAG TPA: tyrosine--tRNA ligase [Gemmatimonadales bacterium]|nr:tyrosine--tRNA ligase [Gemmatimonadales bacterium]
MTALLPELTARGFVADLTPGLEERLARGPIIGYAGFDPTADSLHVGNLVPVMGLAWLQRAGGTPIVLIGGGTGLIGDPSGKRAERPMLDAAQVVANARGIEAQLRRFVSFEGKHGARVRNNLEWLAELRLIDFLREVGKHFTVSYMLQKESVKSRLETGISFAEFAYMLAQAHDFWHLYRHEGCELQVGGSDQWGNITAGCELVSRREGHQVHGLVFPLLTTGSGAKFGKSDGDNIWLDPRRTSPYRFYQFWLNQEDADVERFLKLFTFLPLEEIAAIGRTHRADPGKREGQRRLAAEVTALVHGRETADRAAAASEVLFGGQDVAATAADVLAVLADELPVHRVTTAGVSGGMSLVDALVAGGLAATKAEARRGLEQRSYSVNGQKADANRALGGTDLLAGRYVLLQKGKKHHAMLVAD